MNNLPIQRIEISSFNGNLVLTRGNLNVSRYELQTNLDKGTYIIKVTVNGKIEREKLVVL